MLHEVLGGARVFEEGVDGGRALHGLDVHRAAAAAQRASPTGAVGAIPARRNAHRLASPEQRAAVRAHAVAEAAEVDVLCGGVRGRLVREHRSDARLAVARLAVAARMGTQPLATNGSPASALSATSIVVRRSRCSRVTRERRALP